MALYKFIPHSIFHLAWLLYVRPETFGPTLVLQVFGVCYTQQFSIKQSHYALANLNTFRHKILHKGRVWFGSPTQSKHSIF